MAYAITRILDLNFLNVTNHVMEWEEEESFRGTRAGTQPVKKSRRNTTKTNMNIHDGAVDAYSSARMRARVERDDWPDAGVHGHEATASDDAALVDLQRVLLDGDVVLQLGAQLHHPRHGQLGFVERLLQLADRVVQFLHLAQQPAHTRQKKR